MKRYFSGITAQQAPSPRAARQALESSAGALHSTRVTTLLAIDENRLARSQRTTRLPPRGDRAGVNVAVSVVVAVMTYRSTNAMRALYQFMNRLMDREMVRNTSMISAIASIACPVWFSVVLAIETMSW